MWNVWMELLSIHSQYWGFMYIFADAQIEIYLNFKIQIQIYY